MLILIYQSIILTFHLLRRIDGSLYLNHSLKTVNLQCYQIDLIPKSKKDY